MAHAELTWTAGSAPTWFTRPKTVTHPGINRARRKVTALIETNELPLNQTANAKTITGPVKKSRRRVWAHFVAKLVNSGL